MRKLSSGLDNRALLLDDHCGDVYSRRSHRTKERFPKPLDCDRKSSERLIEQPGQRHGACSRRTTNFYIVSLKINLRLRSCSPYLLDMNAVTYHAFWI